MSFKLPPEVTVKSEQYQGKHAYVLRHEKLGELGRLVLSVADCSVSPQNFRVKR